MNKYLDKHCSFPPSFKALQAYCVVHKYFLKQQHLKSH